MLVLSRKCGQRIFVGNDICITVVRTGDTVRLGIDAPKDVAILREELSDHSRPQAAAPAAH